MLYEIQTHSDNPGEYKVVGSRSGRVYSTHSTMSEAVGEVERREKAAAIRRQIKTRVYELMDIGETDGIGFCTACGEEHDGIEPDARGYTCEVCGAPKVYGIEEILLSL